MWRDPGTWIAIGISVLFIVVGIVMHRVFIKILKQGSGDEPASAAKKATDHE